MLTYLAIADRNRPTWLVWENVPGVLSSNGGKDFGTFLGGLGELGYGFAYRVLDAQYFGVAQRRRRVFVVGYLGDWRPAAAVLFERESVCGNPAPRRGEGQKIAGTFKACASSGGWSNSVDHAAAGYMQPTYGSPGNWIGRQPENGGNSTQFMEEVAPCLTSADKHGVAQPMAFTQNTRDEVRWINGDGQIAGALAAEAGMKQTNYVAQPIAAFKGGQGSGAGGIGYSEHVAPTLSASDGGNRTPTLLNKMAVRRLTPVECERLQGFPDNYTNIPWRKADQSPDGPRYKALGNSMAVPVMAWIGRRIRAYNMQTEGMVA